MDKPPGEWRQESAAKDRWFELDGTPTVFRRFRDVETVMTDRFIGSERDMWGTDGERWAAAPVVPADIIVGTFTCHAVPSHYLRMKDGKLQQLWSYDDSAGRVQAAEWIDVPNG